MSEKDFINAKGPWKGPWTATVETFFDESKFKKIDCKAKWKTKEITTSTGEVQINTTVTIPPEDKEKVIQKIEEIIKHGGDKIDFYNYLIKEYPQYKEIGG